ncbi:GFA family protein [Iodidimonas sp. SYSU 1G8]|uniref:GFA family protein n=1 Tax=Iodidimonas sp. SYSU 1G8 TaxID=3133967 RepID=UPI0031FF139E
MTDTISHNGGCHCGAVAFEVDAPADVVVQDCTCSLCRMTGYLHLIVPASRFRLVRGEDALLTYTFNTGTARHLFCKRCGIKSFYVPRSNPDGFSVNLRCVNRSTFESIVIEPFDGANWEVHGDSLRHLSLDP